MPPGIHESTVLVAVGDEFTRSRIDGRVRTRLEDALSTAFGTSLRLTFTVEPGLPVRSADEVEGLGRGTASRARRRATSPSMSTTVDRYLSRLVDKSSWRWIGREPVPETGPGPARSRPG